MSSGSWMMPRPSSHDQMRFTMLRANQGFFASISQSAKTSRGSLPGDNVTVVPSGKTAASDLELARFGSKMTISSFHSPVGLKLTYEKKTAMPAHCSFDQLW